MEVIGMKKKRRSFPKQQSCTAVLKSSGIGKSGSEHDHFMDAMDEPSAYEVLLAKKREKVDMKSDLKQEKVMSSSAIKDCVARRNFTMKGRGVLASNCTARNNSEFGMERGELDDSGKEGGLTREEIRKKVKRKHKTGGQTDGNGRELHGPLEVQREVHSSKSVFSSLFKKCNSLEEMENLQGQNMCGKSLQKSKMKKRKIQEIQKRVIGKEIVGNLNEGNDIQESGAVIFSNSKDEKFFETKSGKEDGYMRIAKKGEKEVKIWDNVNVWSVFADVEDTTIPKKNGNDSMCENFVKCYRIGEDGNFQSVPIDFEQKPFSASCDSLQNGLAAIQWLMDPYDVKEFFRTVFQKKVFYVCRNNPSYYGNLFSTAKFINILQTEFIEYGTNLNVAVYKNQRRSTLNGTGKVYLQEIQKSIQAGCSVQFTNPQSFSDNVWYYCDLLQEVFGCFVGSNTYITPANTAGFAPHWDDIDAFLLQLEGRKHWKIYAPIDDDEMLPRIPSDNFMDDDIADRAPVFDDWLEQGDLLYIPRGFIHQGFADKDVHSLHLTVSVCRNVAYADLLGHIIPPAVFNFAEQHVNIRKSLPVGYLDMAGVLQRKYPLVKTGAVKFHRILDSMFVNFCNYVKELDESAIDMMAREFMKTALPPVLTQEEKDMTASSIAGSSIYLDKEHIFTKDTPIKLLRRHGQRLIYESEERCFIVHRIANSRVYEGRPEVLFDVDIKLTGGFANLIDIYPHWCLVSDLKCSTMADNIRLARLLYSNGLLMAQFPKNI
uniref:Bifunctional lysine-specific demethylase and histidyl-hydroxylase n=1 Tax=Setaria digitata TaxID=48799 RepID=A0A915Q011_9BILA